jgi:pimeloyl-ACP methyl ester carboxylesterase
VGTSVEPIERRIVANGLSHHVLIWNEAGSPTVLSCHGFLDIAWSFHWMAQPLAQAGLRVVAFDWRGHGETDHIGAGGYYHFPDYVLDLHELVPIVAPAGMHLVGHSMGGTAAVYYAGTHPVRTLTLIEGLGPPAQTSTAQNKMSGWLDSVDRARKRQARPMRDLDDAIERMRVQNPHLPNERARFLAEKSTIATPDGLAWRFDKLHRTLSPSLFNADAFMSFLASIDAPTLIVSGEQGFRTADHTARAAVLKSARELVISGVGHTLHQLVPDELARAILEHVRA